jgi:hypothetical protein
MALKCEKAETGLITSTPIVLIVTVPYETWYRGCAPTSASMVLEYWDGSFYHGITFGNWGSVVATWVRS